MTKVSNTHALNSANIMTVGCCVDIRGQYRAFAQGTFNYTEYGQSHITFIFTGFTFKKTLYIYIHTHTHTHTHIKTKLNSVAFVRERTIPTERPPPVGEVSANFCG